MIVEFINSTFYNCMKCQRRFRDAKALKRHFLSLHTDNNNKPFHCHVCGQGFGYKHVMKRHIKNVHLIQ